MRASTHIGASGAGQESEAAVLDLKPHVLLCLLLVGSHVVEVMRSAGIFLLYEGSKFRFNLARISFPTAGRILRLYRQIKR